MTYEPAWFFFSLAKQSSIEIEESMYLERIKKFPNFGEATFFCFLVKIILQARESFE